MTNAEDKKGLRVHESITRSTGWKHQCKTLFTFLFEYMSCYEYAYVTALKKIGHQMIYNTIIIKKAKMQFANTNYLQEKLESSNF